MHIYICICARALICRMIELWMEGAGPTRMEILLALEICINRPLAWRAEGQVAAPLPCCVHCTERPSWLRDLSLVVVTATPDPFGRAEREFQAYRSDGLRPVRIRGEPATTHSVASHVAVSVPNILLDVNRGTPWTDKDANDEMYWSSSPVPFLIKDFANDEKK